MARIFLSYSITDKDIAIQLDEWLADNGWSDVYIFLDAERGVSPGERWQDELRKAADRCEAVVFLISPAWLESKWCLAEYMLARNLNKKIFGVVVRPVDFQKIPAEMTAEWQLCDLVGTGSGTFSEDGLARLKIGLTKAGLDAKSFIWPPANDPDRAPYRGLEPLEADDAAVFFGRDAQIIRALDQLRGLREQRFSGLFVILAASGAGKSSFLRAGLIPRLRRDDRNFLVLDPVRPQSAALTGTAGLAGSLQKAAGRLALTINLADIEDSLTSADGLRDLLTTLRQAAQRRIADIGNETPAPLAVLLPIDQAEELFYNDGRDQSGMLLQGLANAFGPAAPVQLIAILTIRSDRHDSLQQSPELKNAKRQLFDLPPMHEGHFKDIIVGPAERSTHAGKKLEVEIDLLERLLEETQGADALPILAFTLEQLNRRYGADGKLELHEYEELLSQDGGVISAVVDEALKYPDRDPRIPSDQKQQQKHLRNVFSGLLVSIDRDTGLAARRQIEISKVDESLKPIITRLTDARVLRQDVLGGTNLVEIAHDSVLEKWPPLRQWINADHDFLVTLNNVEKAEQDWRQSNKDESLLIPAGSRLVAAEDCIANEPERAAHVRDYISKSTKRARRTAVRLRGLTIVSVVAALTAFFFGFQSQSARELAEAEQARAEQLAQKALARQLAAQVEFVPEDSIDSRDRKALLATESLRRGATGPGIQLGSDAAVRLPRFTLTQSGSEAPVVAKHVQFSGDGTLVAAGNEDGTAGIWDISSGERLQTLSHDKEVTYVQFSADDTLVATASSDGTAGIWDTETGTQLQELSHDKEVTDVQFSTDDMLVATASMDGKARIWDTETGTQLQELEHNGAVWNLQFNADRTRVTTNVDNNTAVIWKTETGERVKSLDHKGRWPVRFSPDGSIVATASQLDTVVISDTDSGVQLQRLKREGNVQYVYLTRNFPPHVIIEDQDGTVTTWQVGTDKSRSTIAGGYVGRPLGVSPNIFRVATEGDDGKVSIWNALNGTLLRTLATERSVGLAEFNRNGTRIAIRSKNSTNPTLEIWDTTSGERLQTLAEESLPRNFVFSADSLRVATVGEYGTARIWDTKSGDWLQTSKLDGSRSVRFSSDGTQFVSAGDETNVRDTKSGELLHTLQKRVFGRRASTSANFNTDGTLVAAASYDDTALIWDTKSGELLHTLEHKGHVNSVQFSPDGTLIATASQDETAGIWDRKGGQRLLELAHEDGAEDGVRFIQFSPDGTRVATSTDETAGIWDTTSGERLQTLRHEIGVLSVQFSPDGTRVATGGKDSTAGIWDTESGERLQTLRHEIGVLSVQFSPDGTRVATGGKDRTAGIWDTESGERLQTLEHRGWVSNAQFSPDGTRVATASDDGTAGIWDTESGEKLRELAHEKPVFQSQSNRVRIVQFSPNGTRVATASDDGTAGIWDTESGERLQTFAGKKVTATDLDVAVRDVRFSADGTHVATAIYGNNVIRDRVAIWLSNRTEMIDVLCARLTRNLTRNEWNQYLIGQPYRATCPNLDFAE